MSRKVCDRKFKRRSGTAAFVRLEELGQLNSQLDGVGPVATKFVLTKANPDWRVDWYCEQKVGAPKPCSSCCGERERNSTVSVCRLRDLRARTVGP